MLRFFLRLFALSIALLLLCFGFLHFLVLQSAPSLASMEAPTPADVRATKGLVRDLRDLSQDARDEQAILTVTPEQLSSFVKLGTRFTADFRGNVVVADRFVVGEVAVPIPWIGGRRWLNVSGIVPEYEYGFLPSDVQVGTIQVNPKLAVWLARIGGNFVAGNEFGDRVLDTPQSMRIQDDQVHFAIKMDEVGQNGMMRGFFGSMRGEELPTGEKIVLYEESIITAMEKGQLLQEGSYLPYVQFLLDQVIETSTDEALVDNYTAGIIALAKVCGARDFALVIGGIAFDDSARETDADCGALTFNERIDSRRHFTTAAALQAASNRGFSVSVGEFKELNDSLGGGFDFTDISANNSGIRLSDAIMSGTIADLKTLREKLLQENDVIIRYDGIPQIMSEEEFRSQFDDIDSPAYQEMIGLIESRIDQLAIYQ